MKNIIIIIYLVGILILIKILSENNFNRNIIIYILIINKNYVFIRKENKEFLEIIVLMY